MYSDKKEVYTFFMALERISNKINTEINNLKKKLEVPENKPEIRTCSYRFFEDVLKPLFNEKGTISLEDIIDKSNRKKTTLLCYLSELNKYEYIVKTKNDNGDKRTRLYKKSNNFSK